MPGNTTALTCGEFVLREMRTVARPLLTGKMPQEIERLTVEGMSRYPAEGQVILYNGMIAVKRSNGDKVR